jgi:glutamate/tyrosine decarboxylase-like PLP-dependent enzyme
MAYTSEQLVKSVVGIEQTAQQVADHVAAGPLTPAVEAEEIRRHLADQFRLSTPMPLDDVVDDVVGMLDRWTVQVSHPRYFGLFNPSVTTASVVADALVAAYNPQLAAWAHAPAANEIERFTLDRIMEFFGYDPASCFAAFTSGGAEANLSALLAALVHRFHEFPRVGARGLPRSPVVFATSQSHHSIHKAAQMAGLGRDAVREVPIDATGRMNVGALERLVHDDRDRGNEPVLIVGTVGSTSTGVIDPLADIGHLCREQRIWFHADAAWGGAAALSPRLRSHLDGIHLADSITCDAHKWLSVPMAAGMFFCRHPDLPLAVFDVPTPYMPAATSGEVFDPYANTAQWSRRFIGLKVFMSLAEQGLPGYAAMIEHQADMGDRLRRALADSGWEIVNQTPLPLVCFTREHLDVDRFLQEMYARQIAWMSKVPVNGQPSLRACITSYRTTSQDIDQVVADITNLADALSS